MISCQPLAMCRYQLSDAGSIARGSHPVLSHAQGGQSELLIVVTRPKVEPITTKLARVNQKASAVSHNLGALIRPSPSNFASQSASTQPQHTVSSLGQLYKLRPYLIGLSHTASQCPATSCSFEITRRHQTMPSGAWDPMPRRSSTRLYIRL